MADDKKNIPDVSPPTEASAPTAEVAAVPEQPAPEPALTDHGIFRGIFAYMCPRRFYVIIKSKIRMF